MGVGETRNGGGNPGLHDPRDLENLFVEPEDHSQRIRVAEELRSRVIDDGRKRGVERGTGGNITMRKLGTSLDGHAERGEESGADGANRHTLNRLACAWAARGD